MTAFRTNDPADRQAYFDAVSEWFQHRDTRSLRAAPSASIADTAGAKPVAWPVPESLDHSHDIPHAVVLRFEDADDADTFLSLYSEHMGAAPPAPSVADAAGASLPENIDWTRVMALAEKHGDGWSNEKGWSFHCDDDLFNFAGELAKESGND